MSEVERNRADSLASVTAGHRSSATPGHDDRHLSDAGTVLFHGRVLRAGWGLLLFGALFYGVVFGLSLLVNSFSEGFLEHGAILVPRDVVPELIALAAVAIATLVLSFLEQRLITDYGFRGSAWKPLLVGMGTGGVLIAALVLVMQKRGLLLSGGVHLSASAAIHFGLIWAAIALTTALLEVALFAGYLQYTLTRGLGFLFRRYLGVGSGVAPAFWISAIALSGAFAALYSTNTGQTNIGVGCVFVMGLLYAFSLWRTGSLWWALGFHAAWNWTQAFVFGLPAGALPIRDHLWSMAAAGPVDLSGGTAGPDGSLYVFGVLVVAMVSLLLLRPQRVYPELWDVARHESSMMLENTLPDPDRS